MEYTTVESRFDAKELAGHLTSPHRDKPVVVISSTKLGPRISPTAVARRMDGAAEVFLLADAPTGYLLEELLPDDTHVYGGAARSYPPGTEWIHRKHLSPVRLAYSDEEADRAVESIIRDVDRMSVPAAASSETPAPAAAVRRSGAEGTVAILMSDSGAVVKLDDPAAGAMARIDTEAFAPGISPETLMHTGMRVRGILADGVLDVSGMLNTPADAADHAEEATIQPALVLDGKTVALFPGLDIRHRTEGIVPGTVIAVEIELSGRADGKAWRLCTVGDIGPDEVSEALPLFRGGDPWIRMPEPAEEPVPAEEPEVPADRREPADSPAPDPFAAWETVRAELARLTEENRALTEELQDMRSREADVPGPGSPVPGPGSGGAELERANREIARLDRARRELLDEMSRAGRDADAIASENASLNQQVIRLREDVRTERDRANRARQNSRAAADTCSGPLFADPAEQFRFDVLTEWATRIPASSKADLPLPEYDLGPGFLCSVDALHGIDRSKIVAVAVEVLTGLAEKSPGREMHPMREGNQGMTPPPGTDPGKGWRVSLQVASASARRMHFWRGAGGRITFANVGVHDEIIS